MGGARFIPGPGVTTDIQAVDLPFREAVSFFREKARVPTQRWNDVWRGEHSQQFMVAGATSDALLRNFQDAIAKALERGTTLAEFRKDFDSIVDKHGWSHTGSRNWRSRIIYETNLATSYSAGRYAQLTEPETLAAFPFWQYKHSGSAHPRLQHLAWDGLTLRADDPFWATHYPPNGWRCGCRVVPRDAEDLRRVGKSGPDAAPPMQYRPWRDKVTGQVHQVPIGIDPGWDYNPGLAKARGETTPVTSDPMQKLPLPSSPRAPDKGAPLPAVPAALQAFLDKPEGSFSLGELPEQLQKALGSDTREVMLSADDVAKQRGETGRSAGHPELEDKHYGLLPLLVRDPTVSLVNRDQRVLLLRRSGGVWMAVVKTTRAADENYLISFRRTNAAELLRMLAAYDLVYGDADDLGSGDDE